MPGNTWALVAGLQLPKRPFVTARKAFLSPWTGCDKKGEGCAERKLEKKERERRALLSAVGLSGFFQFCHGLHTVAVLR